ncbi:DUF4249 domain-containing protein [Flavobacterium haoranii]|uniref:DUF4249 domain-containing protein n=1 Tax=Flavobacterium haoranii TaxID=683124 RepID=A0A1M6M4Y8_9FLAO|nr:DUF4249 domain-containing protein [Flavobacterium haoranii]SHJ78531.1 protein of unknown function [Flavobacterium haoranii]
MVKIILKITTFIVLTIVTLLILISCEDVVDVDLETAEPKLVIDASLKWQKGTTGNEQTILLSTTAGFYENEVPTVRGATVFITDGNGIQYDFIEIPGTGNYVCTNFNPEIRQTYTLTVIHNSQVYTATESLIEVPTIDYIEQNENGGITGNQIEVKFFYQDNGLIDNYYLINFNASNALLPIIDVIDDEFFQGNQMFAYLANDLNAGDSIQLQLNGISETYYNYMNILLSIAGSSGGSPFQTPPATVRGNIVNQTNFDNYALGFFRLSETDTMDYVIE